MTILEAINRIDSQVHNTATQEEKIFFLSKLDGMVKRLIIDTHVGTESKPFAGYTKDTPLDTVLLVPEPFDDMYIKWLEAQIYYQAKEYDKYNNAILMHNADWDAYAAYYNRMYMPISRGQHFIF